MNQQLRKPTNWQDFEELCMILWSQVWNCPETKRNGRSGQDQHGVDVYGTPQWEVAEYYGIQCKGKDEYSHAQLTVKEIDIEIQKAKKFKPALKKFYFATTANKDTVIEEYIRLKNVESQKLGLFQIHLYSWEEIVILIDQNKRAHDYYVKKNNFISLFDVQVTFHNGLNNLEFKPTIVRNKIKYVYKKNDLIQKHGRVYMIDPVENRKDRIDRLYDPQPKRYEIYGGPKYNASSSKFSIRVLNCGNSALENFKLYFDLSDHSIISEIVSKRRDAIDLKQYPYNTFMFESGLKGVFEPYESILVQKDSTVTEEICIRPTIESPQTINLKWNLVAKDFDKNGELVIHLNTQIIDKESEENFIYGQEDEVRLENYFVEKINNE